MKNALSYLHNRTIKHFSFSVDSKFADKVSFSPENRILSDLKENKLIKMCACKIKGKGNTLYNFRISN